MPAVTQGAVHREFAGQIQGLALKQGLTVLNAPGTVDADYRRGGHPERSDRRGPSTLS